jgi:hypothetical protein
MRVRIASTATPSNFMEGVITSFTASSLVVNVDLIGGSGTIASWAIGVAGAVGSTGPQGATGTTGATGPAGPTGPAGSAGATGSTGPQGPAGNTGATGPQGPQGLQGTTGPAGANGAKGANWRGTYAGATTYIVDDVVQNDGSSWICVQNSTGNAPPTLPTQSNTYWNLVSAKGFIDVINSSTTLYSGNGSTVAFTLPAAPGSANRVWVYINGVYQFRSTYSVSGSTLTFNVAPPTGTNNIEVTIDSTVGSSVVPTDGSVTTLKLADNSVTSTKIADNAITSSKLDTNAVSTVKVANGAITDVKLATDSVTTSKIANTSVTTEKLQTGIGLTNPVITGSIVEDIFTITDGASVALDPANGTVQLWTLGANRSPTATNFVNGQTMTLMINDGTAFTITWPGVTWVGGTAPTLALTGFTVIQLWEANNILYGALVGSVA